MKNFILVCLVLLLTFSISARIEVLEESTSSLIFKLSLSEIAIRESSGFTMLSAPGLSNSGEPGAPDIPFKRVFIAVPENSFLDYRIIERDRKEINISKPIAPILTNPDPEDPRYYDYLIDETKYQSTRSELVVISERFRYRNNFIVPVDIYPVRYDFFQGKLEYDINLIVEFNIYSTDNGRSGLNRNHFHRSTNDSLRDTGSKPIPRNNPDNIINELVLNPNSAATWVIDDRSSIYYAPFSKSHFWYRFDIPQTGVYQLTYQDLTQLPLGDIDPSTLRIFTNGGALMHVLSDGSEFKEIPIHIEGDNPNVFESTDRIIFYAENRDCQEKNSVIGNRYLFNPYSGNGVYWLTFGGSFSEPPKRISTVSYSGLDKTTTNSPFFQHFESENIRLTLEGYDWYQTVYSGSSNSNHSFNFQVNDLEPTKPQKYTISLKAQTSGQHRIKVFLNNNEILNQQWTGTAHRIYHSFDKALIEGTNSKNLEIIRTQFDSICLDFYRVEYYRKNIKRNDAFMFDIDPENINQYIRYLFQGNNSNLRIFEIDQFYSLRMIQPDFNGTPSGYSFAFTGRGSDNTRYIVTEQGNYMNVNNFRSEQVNDLTLSSAFYDGIIITSPEFFDQSNELADYHFQHYNLKSKVVLQQDIFNQFNSGMPDPKAINLYLRYALENFPYPGITYAVLVGSGTNDWRNFSGSALTKNKIIVYQFGTDFYKTSSDDFMAYFNQSNYPELVIGRIPVQSTNQMNTYLNKWQIYANYHNPGLWRNTVAILADDEYYRGDARETIHTEQGERLGNLIDRSILVNKIFGIEYPLNQFNNKPEARDEVIRSINEGLLAIHYIGHGDPDRLGDEDYFRGSTDIPSLFNLDKLTLFNAASCDVAQYDSYLFDSLSERMILYPNGGAIASIAATRKSGPSPNENLFNIFFDIMLNQKINSSLALLKAKVQLSPNNVRNSRMYNFLGCPVIRIAPPRSIEDLSLHYTDQQINALETVGFEGDYKSLLNGINKILAFDTDFEKEYSFVRTPGDSLVTINYSDYGNTYFRGQSEVSSGTYEGSFIVPYDIRQGDKGRIITYYHDSHNRRDYVNYLFPVLQSSIPHPVEPDTIPPVINIWIDSENFRDGDTVSSNPVLYADLFDESGINIMGELGHKILLILNNQAPIDVTSGFIYDTGSFQKGHLTWELGKMSEGSHRLQILAFDNFNNPSVEETSFIVRSGKDISIESMLPYPNPIKSDGYFTFLINENADVTISIYTIRGRRIRTIRAPGLNRGYNQIHWDGRDQDGDRLANNTYFYKVRAKSIDGSSSSEKIGKVMVYR